LTAIIFLLILKILFFMKVGWKEVALGEVCGKVLKVQRKKMPKDEKFIYLDIGGIDNKTNKIVSHKEFQWENAPSRAQQIVKKGDVLFSTVRTYLKNIAQVNKIEYHNQICSSGFTVIRGIEKIVFQDFLFFLSLYEGFLQPLNELQTGSSYPAVRNKDVFNQKIYLPPLPEQQKIVTKIETLFSELDNGIANLKAAKAKLTVFRQSVLKKAFEGELTKDWREKQVDLPNAETLLAEIKAERIRHFEAEMTKWKDAVKIWEVVGKIGRKPKKPRKLIQTEDVTKKELQKLKALSFHWKWVTWEDILAYGSASFKRGPFGSSLKKAFFVSEGYKVYEQYCPINDDCSFERYYITPEKYDELKGFAVKANDFLVSCSGVTLGRITQVPQEFKEGIINQAILRLRINLNFYDDKFFKLFFRSPYFQDKIFENSTGSAIPNIKGVKKLKAIPVPLLSLVEQIQIVKEIESRLSAADNLLATIEGSLLKAEGLRQSVLKSAFEGKLV
jgi:type I restriction enzyme S subunit